MLGLGDRFDIRNLEVARVPGGMLVGVSVFRVSAGSGLVEWLIASRGNKTQVVLPDIATIGLALPSGQVHITVYGGHASDGSHVYESLLYRHLEPVMASVLLGVLRMVRTLRCSRIVRQPLDERVALEPVLISVPRQRITRAMSGVSTGSWTSTTRTRDWEKCC
ncbi:MAG: hypothetical protein FWD57_07140 [Polyangiaceae bacterium]|nr:hypothetical protein [Polyangiaceae bacterium]